MAILRNLLLKYIPAGGVLATTSVLYATRQVEFVPLLPSDPILHCKYHKDLNPNGNPTIHDLHIRKVPLSQIEPSLLRDQEKLVEKFCGGIWAGSGFAIQRTLLTLFSKNSYKNGQLWTTTEMARSDYQVGTVVTDEFEVLHKSDGAILMRGGDSVSNKGLRPLDALMEITAQVNSEDATVEFGFKSLFFQGIGKSDKVLMPGPVVWLHELYAKALLEFGVRSVLK